MQCHPSWLTSSLICLQLSKDTPELPREAQSTLANSKRRLRVSAVTASPPSCCRSCRKSFLIFSAVLVSISIAYSALRQCAKQALKVQSWSQLRVGTASSLTWWFLTRTVGLMMVEPRAMIPEQSTLTSVSPYSQRQSSCPSSANSFSSLRVLISSSPIFPAPRSVKSTTTKVGRWLTCIRVWVMKPCLQGNSFSVSGSLRLTSRVWGSSCWMSGYKFYPGRYMLVAPWPIKLHSRAWLQLRLANCSNTAMISDLVLAKSTYRSSSQSSMFSCSCTTSSSVRSRSRFSRGTCSEGNLCYFSWVSSDSWCECFSQKSTKHTACTTCPSLNCCPSKAFSNADTIWPEVCWYCLTHSLCPAMGTTWYTSLCSSRLSYLSKSSIGLSLAQYLLTMTSLPHFGSSAPAQNSGSKQS